MKLDKIIIQTAAETNLPKSAAHRFASKLFDGIRAAAEAGERVNVAGIGTFSLTERAEGERIGKDGTLRTIKAARYVTMKPSRAAVGKPKRKKRQVPVT